MFSLHRRQYRLALTALTAALALTACGQTDEPDDAVNAEPTGVVTSDAAMPDDAAGGGAGVSEPCDLTEPAVVAEVFGGTVSGEQSGPARNCTYEVTGGASTVVVTYYYGPADQWDGIRGGYESNRGPLTDVSGVGDEAFHPGDIGTAEIVVRSGEVVFAVGLGSGDTDAAAQVKELAIRIADTVGG